AQQGYQAETHVISNGVSGVFCRIETEKPPEWQDKFVILMVGRLSREKRQDLLIEAARRSKYAQRIQLVLAGKGPTRGHYARLAKKLPHAPVMRLYTQQELLAVMNQSDLYVHASDAEIEGISAMEAMACGLVPVMSNSPLAATQQYALCEESLFAAGDADDLAAKIDYWIEHPKQRAHYATLHMAQQEQNRVESCAQQMLALYRQAIKDARHDFAAAPARRKKWLAPHPDTLTAPLEAACQSAGATRDGFARAVSVILEPVNRGLLGLRILGRQNLEVPAGAVVVCNHVHHLDCTMVKAALRGRKLWIVSLQENFEMPVIGHLVKALGAVPLGAGVRARAQLTALLVDRLAAGDWVLVFPEGMLLPYARQLRPLWEGAFDLAVRAGCPVVPAVLAGRRRGGLYSFKRKPSLDLQFLPPVWPNAGLPPRGARKELCQVVAFAMARALEAPAVPAPEYQRVPVAVPEEDPGIIKE
ncbi:MAG: glycosyltransferase, partial [Oscillospiraceae bacterium]